MWAVAFVASQVESMFVGVCEVALHLPASASLKDKRQVVRSVAQRLRNDFQVSVAEVATQEKWQVATLGISCVSGEARHAEEVLDHAVRAIEESRPDVMVDVHLMDVLPIEP